MKHKEEILRMGSEGFTYSQIAKELGCSKSTISFHLGKDQKTKNNKRVKKYKEDNPMITKISNYKIRKKINTGCRDFQDRGNSIDEKFSTDDVILKMGSDPKCYLSGRKIDINDPKSYCFDHIQSVYKGGDNSLNNLGICNPDANIAKGTLSVSELILLCIDILEYQGYTVTKEESGGNGEDRTPTTHH